MIFDLSIVNRGRFYGSGYIAGTGDGIVTVAGVPSSRAISLFAIYKNQPLFFVRQVWSASTGNYIFTNLDTGFQYLVIARDYAEQFEPFAWDYVKPANDLTIAEQKALWQTWQT